MRAGKITAAAARASFLMALLAIGNAAVSSEDATWTLQSEKDGIQLFSRPVEGSEFLAVKAIMTLQSSPEFVQEAFGDGNGCSTWRAMCKSSTVLKEVSDTERYVHMVLDMPWPISDRDLVMHVTNAIDEASRTAVVNFASASGELPESKWVRAQANGRYLVEVLDEANVSFSYEIHTELGGDLSPGMINPRVADSTLDDMQRLRALAQKNR